MNPRFSIITITNNDPDGFEKTMNSVREQTCRDFEWIVVHGGTDSRTLDLIRENSKDITWYCSGKDTGLYNAMNIGTDMATGDYLIYMNGGDTFANQDTLKIVKRNADEKNNPDIIMGDTYWNRTDGSTSYSTAKPDRKIHTSLPACHQSMYFKREFVGDERYNEKMKIASDYDFYMRLTDNRKSSSAYINTPLAVFAGGGISSTQFFRSNMESYRIQKQYLKDKSFKDEARMLVMITASFMMKTSPKLHRFICDAYRIVKPRKQVIMPLNTINAKI